jgi:serine/threonine protein kinase
MAKKGFDRVQVEIAAREADATVADPLPKIGERFRTVRELGRGGMGVVLLVEDRLRGQLVALKRVRHVADVDVRRLKREYRAIERVAHPNIVSVFELGIDAQGPYFLMEPLSGTNLCEWCRDLSGSGRSAIAETFAGSEDPEQRTSLLAAQVSRVSLAATGLGATTCTLEPLALAHSPGTPLDPARLESLDQRAFERLFEVLPQLLAALECLHEHRLVHRDLKPGNVLVRDDGVLKLLDFGILGEAGSMQFAGGQGTAAYVAPEQIRGEPPAPTNDLYALGVMLFEVITGHLPFAGATRDKVLLQHLHALPTPVKVLAPTCPDWLDALIANLLEKNPSKRPTLRDVAERFAELRPRSSQTIPTSGPRPLVERAEQQSALLDLLDELGASDFRFVSICGATGLGKSALLDWTRAAADRRGLTVFHSRTRFSERVPFNAIDGLVDDLAALLERFPELASDAEGEKLRDRAGAAFAVLRRSKPPHAESDSQDAFDALATLLGRCAQFGRRLMLLCDDLQWSDADSVGFLRCLLRAAPPNVLLIATVRDDTHTAPFLEFWSEQRATVLIELNRLSDRALAGIIGEVAADAGRPIPEEMALGAAVGCDGRPLLAVLSGRVAARNEAGATEQPIAWLLSEYSGDRSRERYLLSLLAVLDSGAALPQLARLTGESLGAIDQLLAPLARERLILMTGSFGEQRIYDFSHDLVRRQAMDLLKAHEIRDAHAAVVDHADFGPGRRSDLVRHLLGAERWERAAEASAIAAREAEASKAFGLAADLYEVAIQHTRGERRALRSARAVTLERSGRYVEAAHEWRALADESKGEARLDALLQQAKALLASGHGHVYLYGEYRGLMENALGGASPIHEGREVLELVQRERRQRSFLPEHWADTATAARFALGPWAAPGPERLVKTSPSTPADERDVFLGTMITFFNPIAGVRHMLRARRVYREVGNRIQAAEVDYVLAYVALWSKWRMGATSLGERFARSARQVLGGVVLPEHGRPYALDWMIRGVCALHVGDWTRARMSFDTALAFYESIGRSGTFEHLFCWIQRQYTDRFCQDVNAWTRTLETVQRLIEGGQDSVLRCEIAFARTRHALFRGDVEGARSLIRQARAVWPNEQSSYQSCDLDFFQLAPDVYTTDGVEARQRAHEIVQTYARLDPTGGMYGVDILSHLAWFEAAALRRGVKDASYRRVTAWARQAERACPLGRHMALRAVAYAADYVGKPESALELLSHAEQCATAVDQPIDVAIARYQRGLRLRGSEGQTLVRQAQELLVGTGAHPMLLDEDPARR